MACLILHFGQKIGLAFKGRGTGDPIAFGKLANDF